MGFAERLMELPIVLEVVPPRRRASEKAFESFLDRVAEAARAIPGLDAINLPEILDENHAGQPFYRNKNPRKCAAVLRGRLGIPCIVNKVVVHLDGIAAFDSWARECMEDHGLRDFVVVGGSSRHTRYPGPTVAQANERLRAIGGDGVTIGNITIPGRTGEVERMIAKTRTGCRFFTTQVLFEPKPIATLLRDYGDACAFEGVEPATVLLSFAPVVDDEDVEFLVWLGASLPAETEERLLDAEGEPGAASVEVARGIWNGVRDLVARSPHPVPLGVNVEEISTRNSGLAVRMAREFSRRGGA